MYLKIGLLILLLLPSLKTEPAGEECAVAGQWYIDEVRSPNKPAGERSVWTIKVTKKGVEWKRESTGEGEAVSPSLYIYEVGRSEGRLKKGTRWTRHVEFDENRLIIRESLIFQPARALNWNVYEFEVKDHGHTLYYKHTYGRDVAVRENVLYLRPVSKQK